MQNYFVKENRNYFLFSFPTRRPEGGVADPPSISEVGQGLQVGKSRRVLSVDWG